MRPGRARREQRRETANRVRDTFNTLLYAVRRKRLQWPVFDVHREEVFVQQRIIIEALEHQHWLSRRLVGRWRTEVKSQHRRAA